MLKMVLLRSNSNLNTKTNIAHQLISEEIMNVTVFEDPCPQPGQSMQERIDRMMNKSKRREREKESYK